MTNRAAATDKAKVIALLAAKNVAHKLPDESTHPAAYIELQDGSFSKIYFRHDGKLAGMTRTVKASLVKHINRAVY